MGERKRFDVSHGGGGRRLALQPGLLVAVDEHGECAQSVRGDEHYERARARLGSAEHDENQTDAQREICVPARRQRRIPGRLEPQEQAQQGLFLSV